MKYKFGPASYFLGGSFFSQGVTLITIPLISRIYTPGDIGAISIFILYVSVAAALANLRYESAILLPNDTNEVQSLVVLSLTLTVALSFFSAMLLYFLIENKSLGMTALPSWSALFAFPLICLLSLGSIYRGLRVRESNYVVLVASNVIRNFVNVTIRLLGFFVGGGLFALIIAELVSGFAAFKCVFVNLGLSDTKLVSLKKRGDTLIVAAKKWRRYPFYELPSIGFDQAAIAVPLLIISERFGPASAGIFVMAQRLANLPNSHIGSAYSEILKVNFSECVRANDFIGARRIVREIFLKLLLLGSLVFLPMVVFLPNFIEILLGAQWAGAATLFPWLIAWAASSFIASSLSPILPILQKQDRKLIYDLCALGFMLFVTIFSYQDVYWLVRALSIANIGANMIYLIVLNWHVKGL